MPNTKIRNPNNNIPWMLSKQILAKHSLTEKTTGRHVFQIELEHIILDWLIANEFIIIENEPPEVV